MKHTEAEVKAKELIDKFTFAGIYFIDGNQGAKNNALICSQLAIDEIIKACEYNLVESYNTNWWNEVKQAILNNK